MDSTDQTEKKFRALQDAITEGLASGIAEDFDMRVIQNELDETANRLSMKALYAQRKT